MENLYDYLTKEYNAHFSGWDQSYVNGRIIQDEIPWNYKNIIEKHLNKKRCLLDMDTGDGKILCSLSNLPKNVYATEGYEPNIPIAEKRLKEKNIVLKTIKKAGEIPFIDKYFDIIINRHGTFNANEIKRALKNNGIFITQQPGGLNGIDFNVALGTSVIDHVDECLIKYIEMFQNIGMDVIEHSEKIGKIKFKDIGAVVYFYSSISWQLEDFSIDRYYKRLEIINEIIKKDGFIEFIMHRFYLVVKKI